MSEWTHISYVFLHVMKFELFFRYSQIIISVEMTKFYYNHTKGQNIYVHIFLYFRQVISKLKWISKARIILGFFFAKSLFSCRVCLVIGIYMTLLSLFWNSLFYSKISCMTLYYILAVVMLKLYNNDNHVTQKVV